MGSSTGKSRLWTTADTLLKRRTLKRTPLRRSLLKTLLESPDPLSQADLIESLKRELESADRVTVYRNLNQLKAAGLIHEIGYNTYVACSHECADHPHLILFCRRCQRHREIREHDQIERVLRSLKPFQFFGTEEPLFLSGVCAPCGAESP